MKENKFFIIPFVAVIVVSLIFLFAQMPTAKLEPKDLPIAFVNEDTGETGNQLATKLFENAPDAIQFIEYDSIEKMEAGMNNRESYGGLVIQKNFSADLASLKTDTPKNATMLIYLNEGLNSTVSATVDTMLQKITNQLNDTLSEQMLTQLGEATEQMKAQFTNNPQLVDMISPVQPEMVKILADPIKVETIKLNPTKDLASVPMGIFTSVWMSGLLGAVLFYFAGRNRQFESRKEQRIFQIVQSLLPILYSLFAGYVITIMATWILGYDFSSFHSVALVVSIALLAFVYLIFACLSWIKLAAIPLFAILMFIGLPLIQMAPEMLPEFYSNFILPWLPMRFLVESLKDLLFFEEGIFNPYSTVLLWIALISFLCIWVKNLISKPTKEEEQN